MNLPGCLDLPDANGGQPRRSDGERVCEFAHVTDGTLDTGAGEAEILVSAVNVPQ